VQVERVIVVTAWWLRFLSLFPRLGPATNHYDFTEVISGGGKHVTRWINQKLEIVLGQVWRLERNLQSFNQGEVGHCEYLNSLQPEQIARPIYVVLVEMRQTKQIYRILPEG
jgi:hypothetical protein